MEIYKFFIFLTFSNDKSSFHLAKFLTFNDYNLIFRVHSSLTVCMGSVHVHLNCNLTVSWLIVNNLNFAYCSTTLQNFSIENLFS